MTLFQTGVLLFSAAALALPLAAKPDAEWTAEQSRKYEQHFLQPENPLGFPEYLQTVTVQYASAEAAEKAKLTFPGLPEEQEIAFSTRWDDVNNRHLKMAELLRRHGMKGTFFLTRPGNRNYYRNIGEKLLGNGCAIGSHTISHPSLPNLIPNEAFRQMMLIRPELESNLNTCVVAFVLPGCALGSRLEKQTAFTVGQTIQRCGYLANPEFWSNNESRYALQPGTCFATFLFDADDKNPSMERFEKGLKRQLDRIRKNPANPHITFGLHTWQDDRGFEVLDRIFTKYGHNPRWWYCTENEYAAYRYQILHGKVVSAERKGNTVVYTIRRISPHHLGSEIPLSLKFSEIPRAVRTSVPLSPVRRGLYKLPHDPDRRIPREIEWIKNSANLPLNAAIFDSKKYPGLAAGLFWDSSAGQLRGFLQNRSRVPLKLIDKTLYFPMQWKTPIRSMKSWEILPGKRDAFLFAPPAGDRNPDPNFAEGTHLYVLQCDFLMDGKPVRIYATTEVKQPFRPIPCSRDTALFLGPVPPEQLTPEHLARFSTPGRKLEHLGTGSTEQWRKQAFKPEHKCYIVSPFGTDKTWMTDAYALFRDNRGDVLIVLEFESPEENAACRLFCNPAKIRETWLNGKKLPKTVNELPLRARKGRNRLLVVRKPVRWSQEPLELAVAREDPFRQMKCLQPDF